MRKPRRKLEWRAPSSCLEKELQLKLSKVAGTMNIVTSVFIFEAVWVLTTSSIKNMFRIVLIPVFIIKNVVGEVDEFLLQAVPVCSM